MDLVNIITPIHVQRFEQLLTETKYCKQKTKFLVRGFTEGFRLGYEGPTNVRISANNLKLRIGTKTDMWNKIMKEVNLNRISGPWPENPYKDAFIQSPLV